MKRSEAILAALIVCACLSGCEARALAPNANDAYRDQIRSLESQLALVKARNVELTKSLEIAQRPDGTTPGALDAEVAAETPRPTRLAIAWGSGVDTDPRDASRGMLTLYLEPLDARGRFMQVSGQLSVSVVSVPLPGRSEPAKLGELTLSPKELRERWRGGLTGTHYTIELPLDLSRAAGSNAAAVSVEFREGTNARPLVAALMLDLSTKSDSQKPVAE